MNPRELTLPVAAFGLPGTRPTLLEAPLDDGDWSLLRDDIRTSRVTGHLVAAIEAGAFAVNDRQREDASDDHVRALALDLTLERLLARTVRRFRSAGIEVRALKGPSFAHTVYPRPELRSFGDIDILVRGDQYDDAVALLVANGGNPRFEEPRPGFTRRFGKGVCVAIDGLELDVHRSFVAGPFGLSVDTESLFDDPVAFEIGHETIDALGPVPRFLHACYHAALGDEDPRAVALRDVAQMATASIDHEAVLETARRWRAEIVVQRAVLLAWHAFGLDVDRPLLRAALAATPDAFQRRSLQAYVGRRRSYASQAAAGIRALPTNRERAAYASALLFPKRAYARERQGYMARWRKAGTLARAGRTAG